MLKVVKNLSFLLVCAALITGAVLLVCGRLPYEIYVVHTGSMEPTIPPKSAVIVKKGAYHLGQVISFRTQNGVVTHRLVKRRSDGTLVTKGDGNETSDPGFLQPSEVIGGVVSAPRMLGYWLQYLRNPLGLASLVMAIICLWLIYSITTQYAERKEEGAAAMAGRLPSALRCSGCGVTFRSTKALRAHAAGQDCTSEEKERPSAGLPLVAEPVIVGSETPGESRASTSRDGALVEGGGAVPQHLSATLRCSHCGVTFRSNGALRAHVVEHGDQSGFEERNQLRAV